MVDRLEKQFEWVEVETKYAETRNTKHGEELRWVVNREKILNNATGKTTSPRLPAHDRKAPAAGTRRRRARATPQSRRAYQALGRSRGPADANAATGAAAAWSWSLSEASVPTEHAESRWLGELGGRSALQNGVSTRNPAKPENGYENNGGCGAGTRTPTT